jgi:hypothetical protein
MRSRSLYKYFSQLEYAESFLDGDLLFRSLSYFRDYEENSVRGDKEEGMSVFRPERGLIVNNLTQNTTFTLPNFSFASAARQNEILVFCMSRTFSPRLREEFSAAACVEILDPTSFCARVERALPATVTFPAPHGRARLGHKVDYYDATETGDPRWALPAQIATSKLRRYAWQDEFRLAFSLTDAFQFGNVTPRLLRDDHQDAPTPSEHRTQIVRAGTLRDVGRCIQASHVTTPCA